MIDEKKLIESVKAYKELGLKKNLHSIADVIIEIIEDFPKVGEWIPCSERLPKQDKLLQDYLVTFEYYRYGIYHRMFKTIGIGTFDRLNQKFTFINGQTGWRDLKVLAWQPLPELYKGGVESD